MSLSWESKKFADCRADDVFEFAKLRTDVFFLEQAITEEELDEWDRHPDTIHIWCRDGDQMAGYARVVHKSIPGESDRGVNWSIGRVVVAPSHRRQGVADELVSRGIDLIGDRDIIVHSQDYIQALYARHGFAVVGTPFDEAGIRHVLMIRATVSAGPR